MNMNDNPTGKDYVGSDELYADVQRCVRIVAEMKSGVPTRVIREIRK